jgi:hypothetical protein
VLVLLVLAAELMPIELDGRPGARARVELRLPLADLTSHDVLAYAASTR